MGVDLRNKWDKVTKEQCTVKMKHDFTIAHIPTLAKEVLKYAAQYAKCPDSPHGLNLKYALVFRSDGLTAERLLAKWFGKSDEADEDGKSSALDKSNTQDMGEDTEEEITTEDTAKVWANLEAQPKSAVFEFGV